MDDSDDKQELDNLNLFVKYLPYSMNDNSLKGLFDTFGTIVSAKVMV